MSWCWFYLPLHLLMAACLCHSIKAPTSSSQQSFKSNLFNFYHSLILADDEVLDIQADMSKLRAFKEFQTGNLGGKVYQIAPELANEWLSIRQLTTFIIQNNQLKGSDILQLRCIVFDAPQKGAVISTHSGVTTSEGTLNGRLEFLEAFALFLIHVYRYYFVLEEGRALAPFSITVTPCDVPIEWSILVHKASASFLGKVAQGDHDTDDVSKAQKATSFVSTIFNYKGNSVETYMGMSSHSALYMLEFLSTERDTHITVYLTTDTTSGHLYPELPLDPRLDVIGIGHTTVTLAWKHSPSVLQHRENIQYCLLVNEKHNYKSLCAAETAIRSSGMKLPATLALSLSPYLLEPQQVMILSNSELSIINRVSSGEVRQICMGTKNTYTVPNLSPSTQYYFDVFVVNLLTNTSAAYTGTFARTLEEPEPKVMELKDGKVIQVVLDGKKQKFHTLQYQARHKKVQFTFQLCRGQVRVHITKNGKTVASENILGLRYLSLKGKLLDTYLVQLRSTEESNSSVKVQVSSQFNKPLFPLLPESLKIKSFSKLRTCNSITIAWLGTQEQSKYCVYKKRIEEDQVWMELRSTDRCSGPESRQKSEKVLCKYFYDVNLQRAVTTETIKGLDAGTLYLFDVYLIGPSGIPVRYHSKVVKTRKKC